MKRLTLIILALAAICSFTGTDAAAQAKFTTRKEKLSDLMYKTTKVVLTGNELLDESFKEEVIRRWRITPYEFCTFDEFNTLKGSADYYFLLIVQAQFRKETEPGLSMMTLIKGGSAPKPDSPLNVFYEVISLPLCSSTMSSGREVVFMSAFIDLVQEMATAAVDHGSRGESTLKVHSLKKSGDMTVLISEDDLSEEASAFKGKDLGTAVRIVPEDEADEAFSRGDGNTAVSYVIAPFDPQKGSVCYRLLIGASDHRLYLFEKHKISKKTPEGFQSGDIGKIVSAVR